MIEASTVTFDEVSPPLKCRRRSRVTTLAIRTHRATLVSPQFKEVDPMDFDPSKWESYGNDEHQYLVLGTGTSCRYPVSRTATRR